MDTKFFNKWFAGINEGLEKMNTEECTRLFSKCAQQCASDALKYLYKDLFAQCNGDLDKFFSRVNEQKDLDGKVIESGKIYELVFTKCGCPLYTDANIKSNRLCECSRQSMIYVFENLVPDRKFKIECIETVLSGSNRCCHRIIFED